MRVYTYSEARQKIARVLEEARREGGVRIRRRDGQSFILRPEPETGSPLDVEGVDIDSHARGLAPWYRQGIIRTPLASMLSAAHNMERSSLLVTHSG